MVSHLNGMAIMKLLLFYASAEARWTRASSAPDVRRIHWQLGSSITCQHIPPLSRKTLPQGKGVGMVQKTLST